MPTDGWRFQHTELATAKCQLAANSADKKYEPHSELVHKSFNSVTPEAACLQYIIPSLF